jgi:uncharacterized protein
MALVISSLAVGIIFGFGLSLSEMINPARVIGFLDVAGRWDATLLFVMGGALAVTVPLYPVVLRRPRPLLAQEFALPAKKAIDKPLIAGAVIFGIGWGLGGFCPGPALAGLSSGNPSLILFIAAMVAGQWLAGRVADH